MGDKPKSKAKKTSTVPTKVYRYGLVPDYIRQMEPRAELERQLRLGHEYRNKLVEIELARRDRYNELVARYPTIAAITEQIDPLQQELDTLIEDLKARRAAARQRVRDTAVDARIQQLRPRLRGLRQDLKTAKLQLSEDPAVQTIQEWAQEQRKEAYNTSEASWGTKLKINDSMKNAGKGTPPEFRRFDRCGMIAVQVQSSPTDRSKGCTTDKLLSGGDTRVRLLVDKDNPTRAELWLRIGTEPGRTTPQWARFGVVYHRPLPPGEIKWCWVQRVQAESKGQWGHSDDARTWEVCFALESQRFEVAPKLLGPTCALNLGFRKLDDGRRLVRRHRVDRANHNRKVPYFVEHEYDRLRVAYLVGSDGSNQEVVCEDIWTAAEWANGRRSKRDLDFDQTKPRLLEWLQANEPIIPEWLKTRTRTLQKWRSCTALSNLVSYWRTHRFEQDCEIYTALYAWAQRDRHGRQHETGVRAQAYGRRLDHYRRVAHEIAGRYSVIRIPKISLAEMKRATKVGQTESDLEKLQRRQLNTAAVYELVQALKLAASNSGARIEEYQVLDAEPGHGISQIHYLCGHPHGANQAKSIEIKCHYCGHTFDQDENAARNLLTLSLDEAAE